jgi:hypothetical protein
MTLKVVSRFTTQDGEWYSSQKPYSITEAELAAYGDEEIPGMGGANHIFVKSKSGDYIVFDTSDGKNHTINYAPPSGWINFPLFHSSAYVPARGEQGPWIVWVNNVEVARGLGLPDGLHVSTFLIVEDVDSGSQPQPPTTGEWVEYVMRTKVDDIHTKEEIVWLRRS